MLMQKVWGLGRPLTALGNVAVPPSVKVRLTTNYENVSAAQNGSRQADDRRSMHEGAFLIDSCKN